MAFILAFHNEFHSMVCIIVFAGITVRIPDRTFLLMVLSFFQTFVAPFGSGRATGAHVVLGGIDVNRMLVFKDVRILGLNLVDEVLLLLRRPVATPI